MACKFDEKIIHLYIDGELGETARERVKQHLSICDDCRAKYKSILIIKEQTYSACSIVQAPAYLSTRVIASIDSAGRKEAVKYTLFERLALAFMNIRPSRALGVGLVFAIVMMSVLFPAKRGLSRVAGHLAGEYMAWPENSTVESIATNSHYQAEEFFYRNLHISAEIPEVLAGGMKLTGAGIVDLNGMPVAHARYSDGKMDCSMFIFKEIQPGHKPSSTLVIAGQEYEISSSADVNFICWHKDRMNYVLCGCCCFEKLSELAQSSI